MLDFNLKIHPPLSRYGGCFCQSSQPPIVYIHHPHVHNSCTQLSPHGQTHQGLFSSGTLSDESLFFEGLIVFTFCLCCLLFLLFLCSGPYFFEVFVHGLNYPCLFTVSFFEHSDVEGFVFQLFRQARYLLML